MLQLAPGWTMVVERGPDWLFVRLAGPGSDNLEESVLLETLWSLLEQHFTYRLVLELNDIPLLGRETVDQLLLLQDKVDSQDGLLRMCGLSDENFETLCASRAEVHFPRYHNREEAVMGYQPNRPR